MKIVLEMYGNAYKSLCLKFFPEETRVRLRNGGRWRGVRLRCGTAFVGEGSACDYGAGRCRVEGPCDYGAGRCRVEGPCDYGKERRGYDYGAEWREGGSALDAV